jgi:hypothetical protein
MARSSGLRRAGPQSPSRETHRGEGRNRNRHKPHPCKGQAAVSKPIGSAKMLQYSADSQSSPPPGPQYSAEPCHGPQVSTSITPLPTLRYPSSVERQQYLLSAGCAATAAAVPPPPSQPGSIMLQGPTMDPRIASELLMRLPHLHLRMAEHCRRAAAMAAALSSMGAKVGGMLKS